MDAATKLTRQRLSVLELAEILGNVSEACRRRGISQSPERTRPRLLLGPPVPASYAGSPDEATATRLFPAV